MGRMRARTPTWRRAHALLVVATLALAHPHSVDAQDSTAAQRDGWIVGPLVGLPGAGSQYDPEFVTLGVGVTRLVPNRPGLDFSVGTLPRALPEGLFPIGVRAGPSIPLALGPDVFFIPSAGLSAVGVLGSDAAGGVVGYYWGAATVVARGSVGVRAGITWHAPLYAQASVWLVEIGVMRVPLPRRAP